MENSNYQNAPGLLHVLLIVIVAGLLIWAAILAISSPNKKGNKSPKTENTSDNKTTTVQSVTTNTTVVGKRKTLYRFADYPNGKVTVYLKSDAEFYPKGGKIKYKTSSGKVLTDEPGTAHVNDLEPPGDFIFWADNSSAWGIEIWQ